MVYLMTGKKDAVLATIMLENAPYLITSVSGTLVVEGGGEAQKIWSEFNDLNRYLLESQERLGCTSDCKSCPVTRVPARIPDDSVERGGRGIGVIEKV